MKSHIIESFVSFGIACLICPFTLDAGMVDQRTINELLEDLSVSEVPVFRQRPKAFRDSGPGNPVDFTYVCPLCSARTLYRGDTIGMSGILNGLRKEVKNLRELGLDIGLDERTLCRECGLKILPVSCEVVSLPDLPAEREKFPWRVGDKIEIHSLDGGCIWFEPCTKEFWIWGEFISSNGLITCSSMERRRIQVAYVRIHPDTESAVVDFLHEGDTVVRCSRRPHDPKDWARIDFGSRGMKVSLGGNVNDFQISDKYVGNFCSELGDERTLCPGRIRSLAWLYAGNRVVIKNRDLDVAILCAFLKKKKLFSVWEHGPVMPLKNQIVRLRQILQGASREITNISPRGKITGHGVLYGAE